MNASELPAAQPAVRIDSGRVAPGWLAAAAACALLVLLFGRAMMRPFDLDEHLFVAPAVLLTDEGFLPYQDYPYFHMPLLVYIYAALSAWVPHKLLVARVVSVLCAWGTLLLLGRCGWDALEGVPARSRRLLVGGVLTAYVCSQLFVYTSGWAWNHDSATLCALGAYLLQLRGLRRGRLWPIALAGGLAGLAMGIRLSFALIVLPMAAAMWLGSSPLTRRERAAGLALAAAAALLVLTPAFVLWVQDPGAFVFGNIGYARLNTQYYVRTLSEHMTFPGKLGHLFGKVAADPGNAFLFFTGACGLAYTFWKGRAWRSRFGNELGLLAGLLPVLLVGAFGPTPTQQQYFYMLLPFLTLAVLYVMALQCAQPSGLLRWRRLVLWAALLPAVVGLPRWYWQVIYLPQIAEWTPVRIHQTGEWIKAHCAPGARVLTADSLFPLESGMRSYPEYTAGRFILLVGDQMSPEDRRRYHAAWGEELERVLVERPPDAIFWHTRSATESLTEYARHQRFHKLVYQFTYRGALPGDHDEIFELWVRDPVEATFAGSAR